MPRFFVSPFAMSGKIVTLMGDDHRHLAYSLRMAVGDEIVIADGEGTECTARLSRITADVTEAEILERRPGAGEPPVELYLYQGNPKGDKMEWIVQKAVELGVTEIVPFESSRCITRVKADRTEKQTARLARVAREAAGQCGRARLPGVHTPLSFTDALSHAKEHADAVFFCYEEERTLSLKDALTAAREAGARRLAFFVGPEGGFSPEEAAIAATVATPVSLGRRILRCETAPLFALSCAICVYEL